MRTRQKIWAIVLAAGNGTRLSSISTDNHGAVVPKQYCSLSGGYSLLQAALERARRVVPSARVCAIVARQHKLYWHPTLGSLPARNVLIEPRNRGTAIGVLHGVLRVLERDPHACIVFLPADHYVRIEQPLTDAMRTAATRLRHARKSLLLLGIRPDEVDSDFGYILPGDATDDGIYHVAQFVEKPSIEVARELLSRGALWNSFIFAAHAATLMDLFRARLNDIVDGMTLALARDRRHSQETQALDEFYERLPTVDFSRCVLEQAASRLRVLTTPACGWRDLGTPSRVANVLERLQRNITNQPVPVSTRPVVAPVDLATQWARLSSAS
jgi:mannose-1-phosphate guanylyltransferase